MKEVDPGTRHAIHAFLARVPTDLAIERAILFGSRARGDYTEDSDADIALILSERANDWSTLRGLAGLAFDILLETGILIQPVPISSGDWKHPERYPRPSFLRNIARDGIGV